MCGFGNVFVCVGLVMCQCVCVFLVMCVYVFVNNL